MRNVRRCRMLVIAVLIPMIAPPAASAWNYTGHRVIASVAYRQLDEPTRKRVAAALKPHPAAEGLWAGRATNGPDEALNLFWNASVFPDDARSDPYREYHRPAAHYVNYRVMANQGNKIEPPLDGENVINSYVAHLRRAEDPRTPAAEKALHLSWIFHQAGDVHQPLHTVARFSHAFPDGDRGGNGVTVPNPRARGERGNNLHAYWDDLIGSDEGSEAIEAVADKLIAEYPRDRFADDLKRTTIQVWAEEGARIAVESVYDELDAEGIKFEELPLGYEADSRRVARRRAALAGYRLGEELKRLFAAP